jgi:NifU-like protein involved in Fe-S cluster formation
MSSLASAAEDALSNLGADALRKAIEDYRAKHRNKPSQRR